MKNSLMVTAVLAALGVSGVQAAEESTPGQVSQKHSAKDSKRLLEEVIVTARRTEESQQDVPVAVSTFSSDSLVKEQVTTLQDLQGRVPSLSITANSQMRNTQTPTIRGQGSVFGANPGVVIYYNEVPLVADFPFSSQGGPGKFFDVQNLQILKGAQGTLFGRNTTGGAMIIDPKQPENEFSVSLAAKYSNYHGETYEGVLNLPLIDDVLAVRIAGMVSQRDGFTEDVGTGKDLDNKDFSTARIGLVWRPADWIENYLFAYRTETDDNGTGIVIEDFNQKGINYGLPATVAGIAGVSLSDVASVLIGLGVPPDQLTDPANVGCAFFNATSGSTNCGQDFVDAQNERGIRKTNPSLSPYDKSETETYMHKLTIDLTDDIALRNIASYTTYIHWFNWDADGSPAGMQDLETSVDEGYSAFDVSQTTEEIQLQGSALDETLSFTLGFYYQHLKPEGPQGQRITAFGLALPTQNFDNEQESYAPYGQFTYDLGHVMKGLEGLNLTAGLRYTTDKTTGRSNSGEGEHSAELESKEYTYTVGLDYHLDTHLFYAKVSRGYKAGGFSATAVVPQNYTFKPEFITTYEVGQKSDFNIAGVPSRINTAAYYSAYKDMQRSGIDVNGQSIGSAIFTAGEAAIYGFEIETMFELTEGLRLSANYAYTKGEYDEFNLTNYSANLPIDCSGGQVAQGGTGDYSCAPFQSTPENQVSVTASYDFIADPSVGFVNGSMTYAWTDESYSSSYSLPSEEPGAWLEDFGLLNASLSWSNVMGTQFDVMVYGTNLTDEEYRISNSNVWNLVYYRASIYGEPRMYGARVAYRFGN